MFVQIAGADSESSRITFIQAAKQQLSLNFNCVRRRRNHKNLVSGGQIQTLRTPVFVQFSVHSGSNTTLIVTEHGKK